MACVSRPILYCSQQTQTSHGYLRLTRHHAPIGQFQGVKQLNVSPTTVCLKNGSLQLIWHNFINSWSIERRHFHWPWKTPAPVSRSRHSLMLNISEYGHYFNGILIGTYTRPTQQCHFEWHWRCEWLSKIFNDTKRHAVSQRQLSLLFHKVRNDLPATILNDNTSLLYILIFYMESKYANTPAVYVTVNLRNLWLREIPSNFA